MWTIGSNDSDDAVENEYESQAQETQTEDEGW